VIQIVCPECGEDDDLRGKRGQDSIAMTCQACGHQWIRLLKPKCLNCGAMGEDLLSYRPIPLFAKGRGTMQTPSGQRDSWDCDRCGRSDCTRPRE
jgi:ribosomal protein L37E